MVDERTFHESAIKSVLKRLVRYYGGRAKSSAKAQSPDIVTWSAKRDAVLKVAENLDIRIEERVDDATTAKEASGRRD